MEKLVSPGSNVKHVIAVMSGKGGVGKSSVSGLLAAGLHKKGFSVGVLDADVTGASIPKLLGVNEKAMVVDEKIIPATSKEGVKIMSLNLLLQNEDDAVIWRGPLIAGAIRQFWTDVNWGELDYMIVDMPPGTGDAPLTVLQSLPVEGVVMVTTPQDLTTMIVMKAVNMAGQLQVPIMGLVENMSYMKCPHCGERIDVFGSSNSERICRDNGIEVLAKLPIDSEFTSLCDSGKLYDYTSETVDELLEKMRR